MKEEDEKGEGDDNAVGAGWHTVGNSCARRATSRVAGANADNGDISVLHPSEAKKDQMDDLM